MTEPSITCPRCGMTSHHPQDIAEGYCGACHDWTSPPPRITWEGVTPHGEQIRVIDTEDRP